MPNVKFSGGHHLSVFAAIITPGRSILLLDCLARNTSLLVNCMLLAMQVPRSCIYSMGVMGKSLQHDMHVISKK